MGSSASSGSAAAISWSTTFTLTWEIRSAACLEVIAYDASDNVYPIRTYYDTGEVNEWTMRDGSGVWITTGDWSIGGEIRRVRCAHVFVDPRVRTCLWEYSVDGAWRTFWEIRAMALP